MSTPTRTLRIALFAALLAFKSLAAPATAPASRPVAKPKHVVFLIDATGSTYAEFDDFRRCIRAAINALDDDQQFAIVVMQEARQNQPLPALPTYAPATAANRGRALAQLDKMVPHGSTDPSEAFDVALKLRPDVIDAVLDPSDYAKGGPKVIQLVRDAERIKSVRIHSVAFKRNDDETRAFLQDLSKASGGWHRVLKLDDPVDARTFDERPDVAAAVGDNVSGKRVVFVLDASDSMTPTMKELVSQCDKAIDHLEADDAATVMFFGPGSPPPSPGGPLALTPANKQKLKTYAASVPAKGKTAPAPVLRKAFALKPDVVYWLVDTHDVGDRLDLDGAFTEDRDRATKVNILIFGDADTNVELFLFHAARDTGGVAKFVTAKD